MSKKWGHILAVLTIFIWGTTFISTKVLLQIISPVEILFYRFIIGFTALFIAKPTINKINNIKVELLFVLAGATGVSIYFFCESSALTLTFASNVSLIVSVAPMFTAILSHIFLKEDKIQPNFVAGFLTALAGIFLVSFNGASVLKLNPVGDLLAVSAALSWSFYCILLKKLSGLNVILLTRKVFFYGILTALPLIFIYKPAFRLSSFKEASVMLNILYLGLAASALCFATWGKAVDIIGPVKTSAYIYLNPVITIAASFIILHERLTLLSWIGVFFTLLGLYISERKMTILSCK